MELRQEKMQLRRIMTNTNGSGRIQCQKKKFNARKEKEILKEARHEILKEKIASTSGTKPVDEIPFNDMPSLFDQTNQEQSSEQVSNLRNFLGACVKLLSDKNSLQVLENLLEKCNPGEEGIKRVNQL